MSPLVITTTTRVAPEDRPTLVYELSLSVVSTIVFVTRQVPSVSGLGASGRRVSCT